MNSGLKLADGDWFASLHINLLLEILCPFMAVMHFFESTEEAYRTNLVNISENDDYVKYKDDLVRNGGYKAMNVPVT